MITTETVEIEGSFYVATRSDLGVYVRKTGNGELYDEAIDPAEKAGGITYEETDVKIPDPPVPSVS